MHHQREHRGKLMTSCSNMRANEYLWHCCNLVHGEGAGLAKDASHCQAMIIPVEFGDWSMIPDIVQGGWRDKPSVHQGCGRRLHIEGMPTS